MPGWINTSLQPFSVTEEGKFCLQEMETPAGDQKILEFTET
jgi:hypothetical protein